MNIQIGTCITPDFFPKTQRYLRTVHLAGVPAFCVTCDWEASEELASMYPLVKFYPFWTKHGDVHKTMLGEWLCAVPHREDDLMILTHADGWVQRRINGEDLFWLEKIGSTGMGMTDGNGLMAARPAGWRNCAGGHTQRLIEFPRSLHCHGHFGLPEGAWWKGNELWYETQMVLFAHRIWRK